MSNIDFLHDAGMDAMIKDIIDIFIHIEGVELVRLSGMVKRAQKISGKWDLTKELVDSVIKKLKFANIINYKYIVNCPHCGEKSYIIKPTGDFKNKPKMCDTCNTFYSLIEGSTIEKG
jgi:hypothetical protein